MKEKYIIIDEDGVPKFINGPLLENGDAVGMWQCGLNLIFRISDLKIMAGFDFKNPVWQDMKEWEQTENEQ
jgi:hypothetical protein